MNTSKILIKFGLIGGAVFIVSYLVSHFLFYSNGKLGSSSEVLGYATMLIALSTVYFGVRSIRDKQLSGSITFMDAFKKGLFIVLIASVIYVACWMVYYPIFLPDFMDQYAVTQAAQYVEAGLSSEEIQLKEKELSNWIEMYENPFIRAGMTFLEIFPIGLIVAALSALILKKQ